MIVEPIFTPEKASHGIAEGNIVPKIPASVALHIDPRSGSSALSKLSHIFTKFVTGRHGYVLATAWTIFAFAFCFYLILQTFVPPW